jgi:hypothetical protein
MCLSISFIERNIFLLTIRDEHRVCYMSVDERRHETVDNEVWPACRRYASKNEFIDMILFIEFVFEDENIDMRNQFFRRSEQNTYMEVDHKRKAIVLQT